MGVHGLLRRAPGACRGGGGAASRRVSMRRTPLPTSPPCTATEASLGRRLHGQRLRVGADGREAMDEAMRPGHGRSPDVQPDFRARPRHGGDRFARHQGSQRRPRQIEGWRLSAKDCDEAELDPKYRESVKCKIFLGVTSNRVSSGIRHVFRFLTEATLNWPATQ